MMCKMHWFGPLAHKILILITKEVLKEAHRDAYVSYGQHKQRRCRAKLRRLDPLRHRPKPIGVLRSGKV
jgi:hypothetical protein